MADVASPGTDSKASRGRRDNGGSTFGSAVANGGGVSPAVLAAVLSRGELPMRELLLTSQLEVHTARLAAETAKARRLTYLTVVLSLVLLLGAIAAAAAFVLAADGVGVALPSTVSAAISMFRDWMSAPTPITEIGSGHMSSPPPASPPPPPAGVALVMARTAALAAGAAGAAAAIGWCVFYCCCCCSPKGRERLSLLNRYLCVHALPITRLPSHALERVSTAIPMAHLSMPPPPTPRCDDTCDDPVCVCVCVCVYRMVLSLFWTVIAHYRVVRLRAKRMSLLEPDGDDSDSVKTIWYEGHGHAGWLLHAGFGGLGGLWIKQGQYLASRADMVPKSMGRHLASMLDSNPPRPLAQVVATLESELGEAKLALVAAIDPTPLSVASIAQVHAATLVDGTRVVLKVQHAEVEGKMLQDLLQAEHLATKLAWLEPQVDIRPLLEEMATLHRSELDFTAEAANLRQVAANIHRRNITATLPPVIEALTTRRCLTMGFCEGVALKDAAKLQSLGIDCTLLVARVCEAWATQMFADGCFNCDPHPGNLLVRMDQVRGPVPVLLDFGLCKRVRIAHLFPVAAAICRGV